MRPEDEIDEQLNRAAEAEEQGRSAWPGMTYEQGVGAALRWVTHDTDDLPIQEGA